MGCIILRDPKCFMREDGTFNIEKIKNETSDHILFFLDTPKEWIKEFNKLYKLHNIRKKEWRHDYAVYLWKLRKRRNRYIWIKRLKEKIKKFIKKWQDQN